MTPMMASSSTPKTKKTRRNPCNAKSKDASEKTGLHLPPEILLEIIKLIFRPVKASDRVFKWNGKKPESECMRVFLGTQEVETPTKLPAQRKESAADCKGSQGACSGLESLTRSSDAHAP